MPNATKRKAESEKILQKEASKTSFFSKDTGDCNQSSKPNRVANSEDVQEADIPKRVPSSQDVQEADIPEWAPSSEDVQEEFRSNSPMGSESLSTCDNCQDKHCVVNCTTVNCDRDTSTISTVVPSLENDGTCRETCQVSNQSCQVYLYRGYPLNINAIVKKAGPGVLYLYKDKCKSGKK